MKKHLLLYLFAGISLISTAQSKQEKEVKNFFWGAGDKYKNSVDIPEKWTNESAVILYKNINYEYKKRGNEVTYKRSIRQRIKLLDQNAVKEFSEFSYLKRSSRGRIGSSFFSKGDRSILGVKVIKPDGKVTIIDIKKNAINVDHETKLAIPDLEVGDIIDYYFYVIKPYLMGLTYTFDPVERTLSDEYPIVDFKLYFGIQNDDFYINFNSFNEAPPLKKIAASKKRMRRYTLEAHDIDKNDFPRWFHPLVALPSYKFQVHYIQAKKYKKNVYAFLGEEDKVIKKTVSSKDVLDLYSKKFKPYGAISDVTKYHKDKTFANKRERVISAYYYMRHFYLTRYIEALFLNESEGGYTSYLDVYKNGIIIRNQKEFINHFTEFLDANEIKYEILIAKKRFDGTIDDFLLESNANVLIEVKTSNPIYVQLFGLHTSIGEYNPLIEGTDVYALTTEKNRLKRTRISGINKVKLPTSTYKDNVVEKELNINLKEDFSGFSITSKNSFVGYFKKDEQYGKMVYEDYVNEDYDKYKTKRLIDLVRSKKKKAKISEKLTSLKKQLRETQKETFEASVKGDLDLTDDIEDYDYEITNTGRYGLDTKFAYSESFTFNNAFIKKAGPNYIIEIGRFIGGQVDLDEKKRNRSEHVYMNFPRSFNYSITFNIPEGYTVTGLDKFNINVDNKTGAFISTAKVEGNKLIIKTSKQYKSNFIPNSEWIKMTAFLDAAWQFTNEKIMLKKG